MQVTYHIKEVYVHDEYVDDRPTSANVYIDLKFINRILLLQKTVKKLKVYKISEFSCFLWEPDWLIEEEDENKWIPWDGNIDAITLNVSDDDLHWSGFIKHTGIMVETAAIPISDLLEIKKVFTCPKENLPLLVNNLKTEAAKSALEQRLKGEK